jgi:Skp family chaperone for outer membrane proteins
MTKLFFSVALAALATAIPAAAPAQRLSPAVVAVVDIGRVSTECTACRAAATQLQTQVQQLQQRAQQLQQPLQTEGQSLQTALQALNGKQPDAALQARITAFQTRENSANQELQQAQQRLQSTQANVNRQISERLRPIMNTVLQQRGATIIVDKGSTLASAPTIDVTNDVLAQLNQQLPSVTVAPLPQQPQQQQPTGR